MKTRLPGCWAPLMLLTVIALWGQGTVTVFGTVTDSSGAVIANASILLTNTETGAERRTITDLTGKYFLTQLPIGIYSLRASASGFKTFVEADIPTQVNDNRRVDISMEVGAVTESVSVTGQLVQVETREGVLKEVVDSQRIVELPLNGRNPLQLQYLVAGIGGRSAGGGGQAQNQVVPINGQRANANNYTLDGGDNHDPFFNSPAIFPSPDALEEFSIQTSVYAADKGRNPGATMTAVTKSGTNQFHGTLFEFLRNSELNSRNFFSLSAPPPFKRNQYGGTFGGPIRKDRIFFFFSYQGTRERSAPSSVTTTVFTSAQRNGDFSANAKPLVDPSGGIFPGNIIPASRLYQPSLKFMAAFIPLPNLGTNQLSFASPQYVNDEQYVGKMDWHITSANTLSWRLLRSYDDLGQSAGTVPGFIADIKYWNWNLAINDTHIVSPTMLNTFTFSFQKIDRRQLSIVPGNLTWTDFGTGIVRSFTGDLPAGHDTKVNGYFEALSRFPLNQFRNLYEFSDLVNLSRGAHLIKFGGSATRGYCDRYETFRGDPYLLFNPAFTGDAAADFLLGRPSQISQNSQSVVQPRGGELSLFFQDDWRVSTRLTLNLGVRWEPFLPYHELENRVAQIRLGEQSVLFPTAPAGLVYAGDPGVSAATIKNRWNDFAPRIGFAWDPTGNARMSIRGGYGIYYGDYRLQGYANTGPAYSLNLLINNPPGGLANPYAGIGGNPWPFQPPVTAQQRAAFKFALPITTGQLDANFRNAVSQQWNLSVQRQLRSDFLVTIAYVGSKGDHLYMQSELDPGVYGAGPPNATLDQRRPLAPYFGSITNVSSSANSTYHALQATVNKRLARGFTLLANYTWSKNLDNADDDGNAAANPFNFRFDKGSSNFDIEHRLAASFIYQFPEPRNNALMRRVLGGWQLNGILTLESGLPFSILSGRDNSNSGVNLDRADQVGDPSISPDRPLNSRLKQDFNVAAFAPDRIGTFGNTGRNILRAPGNATFDFGVVKSIPVRESIHLQLRAEAFNVLNRVNFGTPNNNQSSPAFGAITSASDPRVIQMALKLVF